MADSLLAIQFVNDDLNHLYDWPVAVNIAASNRLNRLALDHLANCCSLAAVCGVVFGLAVAVDADADAAVFQPSLDRAEYFDSVSVDFDTTSKINQIVRMKTEMNCQFYQLNNE